MQGCCVDVKPPLHFFKLYHPYVIFSNIFFSDEKNMLDLSHLCTRNKITVKLHRRQINEYKYFFFKYNYEYIFYNWLE